MNAAERAQLHAHLWRLVRYPAFTALAAAIITPLAHAAEIRYPAMGLVIASLEIFVRALLPTVAASSTTSVVKPPAAPPGPPVA